MKKIILLLIFISFLQQVLVAQNAPIKVTIYKRDTSFQCIAVDTITNNVYAGTIGKGLVKYDQKVWRNWSGENVPGFGTGFKLGYLSQIAIYGEKLWVASSGFVSNFTGNANNGINYHTLGGIYRLDTKIDIKRNKYPGQRMLDQCNATTCTQGPPTRDVQGSYIASDGTAWCVAAYQDSMVYAEEIDEYGNPSLVPIYRYVPGAVGRFNGTNYDFITGADLPKTVYPFLLIGGAGNRGKTESFSIGKRRSCRSITQVGNEMWVGSDGYDQAAGNLKTACILRYNLGGTYLGKIDQVNTPAVNFGLTNTSKGPWAMVEDSIGRVWITMDQTRGIAVKDTSGTWVNVGIPSNMPTGTVFRANSIATNKINKEVYFGTNNGLLVYKGKGSFTSDTSYRVYNTSNGLSSNFINGIAVAKDQTIWLATVGGINKIEKGDLEVFNRKPNKDVKTDNDLYRTKILKYNSQDDQETINKDTLLIAADGGKATIFKWVGTSPQNMKFRFIEDLNVQNPSEFGSFSIEYQNTDSLRVLYNHPKYLDEQYTTNGVLNNDVHLQLIDSTQNPVKVIITIPVKFVLPPVLMIHGVWSSTGSFKKMEDFLLASASAKNYKPYALLKIWYPTDIHDEPLASQAAYKDEIPNGINKLIENCALNKMSAGRVDILGHSRGGIFARIYLQETFVNYRNDINKLITINTPHWGAQTANLVLDKRKISLLKNINPLINPINNVIDSSKTFGEFAKGFVLADVDDINGAVELKVNSPAILQSLNGANINKNKTYSHALVSRYLFSQQPTTPEGIIAGDFTFGTRFMQALLSFQFIDSIMSKIFNGENSDIVVPVSSQRGGLAETFTSSFTENIAHSNKSLGENGPQFAFGVLDVLVAQQRVAELLRKNPNGGQFATEGFSAPLNPLQYTFLKPNPFFLAGTSDRITSTDDVSIKINPTLNGTTYNAGDTVFVKIFKQNTDTTIIKYTNRVVDVYSDEHFGNDTIYKFPIPLNALGAVKIEVFGFGNGKIAYDSCSILVNLPANISLDSIKISNPAIANLSVRLLDSVNIKVFGYYNDGIKRNITYQPSLTYSTLTGSVTTSSQGYVKGLILGFDELKAKYLGKTDSIYLEVVAKPKFDTVALAVLPVRFLNVSAKYNGENINVNWATAFELNNNHFDIEYSKNGFDFIKAGTVNASNNSNGDKYAFIHKDFIIGKNYYRIKQVDNNGTFSYSNIVVSIISEKNNVILYPNPVKEVLVVDISKASNTFKKGTIIISNNIGQIIQQQIININSNKIFVNTTNLAAGIYNIQIVAENNKQLWGERFIKNK